MFERSIPAFRILIAHMNKQLLSIMALVALAVTQPSVRLVAAPPDGPGSAAESDRKFLNNLENKDSTQAAQAESAPQPQVVPAPVQPAAPPVQNRTHSARSQTVTNDSSTATAANNEAPAPHPARSVTRSVVAPARTEAAQTRTTATAHNQRAVAVEQGQTSDVQTTDGTGVSARIYKSRPVEGVTATNSKSTIRRTRNVAAEEEEGTHIIQPAEIAQYGVAPTVPTKTTKVTTTYVQQPTTVVPREDHDQGRDEEHGNERNFFHRLFHGGLFNKHGAD